MLFDNNKDIRVFHKKGLQKKGNSVQTELTWRCLETSLLCGELQKVWSSPASQSGDWEVVNAFEQNFHGSVNYIVLFKVIPPEKNQTRFVSNFVNLLSISPVVFEVIISSWSNGFVHSISYIFHSFSTIVLLIFIT